MENSSSIISVSDLVQVFGGMKPFSEKIGEGYQTVRGWKDRNSVPARAFQQIAEEALNAGRDDITAEFLVERAAADWSKSNAPR